MNQNVLVVDDAGFIRHLLVRMLTEAGHNVIGEARTGTEAIAQALKLRPDLILMDLVLPEQSGIEAITEILKIHPEQPIVAMSSIGDEWLRKQALDAGAIYFLEKPFSKETLKIAFEQNRSELKRTKNG